MSKTDLGKLCILMFDEIALKPHFDYNRRKDSVIGFVNNGKKVEEKIADHALVFMIRGVFKIINKRLAIASVQEVLQKLNWLFK